jgi:hypothetical protein
VIDDGGADADVGGVADRGLAPDPCPRPDGDEVAETDVVAHDGTGVDQDVVADHC